MSQLGGSTAPTEGSAGAGLRGYGRQAGTVPEARTLCQKAARLAHVNELRRIKEAERRLEQQPKQARGSSGSSRSPAAAAERALMDAAVTARRASGAAASTSGGIAPPGSAAPQRRFSRGQGTGHTKLPAAAAAVPHVDHSKLQALRGQEGVTFPSSSGMQDEELLPSLQHGPVGLAVTPLKTAAPRGSAARLAAPHLLSGSGPAVKEEVLLAGAGMRESFIDDIMGREAPTWADARNAAALASSMAARGQLELVAAGGGGGMSGRLAYAGIAGGAYGSSAGASRLGGSREEAAQPSGRVLFPSALSMQGKGLRSVSVSAEQARLYTAACFSFGLSAPTWACSALHIALSGMQLAHGIHASFLP